MRTGIYYNQKTKEITSITGGDLLSGSGWMHVTDDARLGLLEARAVLVDHGLVEDGLTVYWHFPQPEKDGSLFLACEPRNRKIGGLGRLWSGLRGSHRQEIDAPSVEDLRDAA